MNDEIVASIVDGLSAAADNVEVQVELDGNRASITVVSSIFAGMSRVKKQQAVYACIDQFIKDGRIHAVTIQAITPTEA
jgi:acid stress-induced BolA-like protein IbaG/YrbA